MLPRFSLYFRSCKNCGSSESTGAGSLSTAFISQIRTGLKEAPPIFLLVLRLRNVPNEAVHHFINVACELSKCHRKHNEGCLDLQRASSDRTQTATLLIRLL